MFDVGYKLWKLKGERSKEDALLFKYSQRFGGVYFTEVRLGSGRMARRIDAVRFLRHRVDREIMRFDQRKFKDHLNEARKKGERVQLIEVKRQLNRSVIGQLIWAEWFFKTRQKPVVRTEMVAACTSG